MCISHPISTVCGYVHRISSEIDIGLMFLLSVRSRVDHQMAGQLCCLADVDSVLCIFNDERVRGLARKSIVKKVFLIFITGQEEKREECKSIKLTVCLYAQLRGRILID